MTKTLEHFEVMDFNKLLIELKDLASNAEQEAIFAKHPELRPSYDFKQDPKITLRKSVEKSLEIMMEMMLLLMVLEQKKGKGAMKKKAALLVLDLSSRIQNSTKKTFDLYFESR